MKKLGGHAPNAAAQSAFIKAIATAAGEKFKPGSLSLEFLHFAYSDSSNLSIRMNSFSHQLPVISIPLSVTSIPIPVTSIPILVTSIPIKITSILVRKIL